MVSEPCFKTAANETVTDSIILDASTQKHYCSRKKGCETNTHLIEDDTSKDKEEYKNIKERF